MKKYMAFGIICLLFTVGNIWYSNKIEIDKQYFSNNVSKPEQGSLYLQLNEVKNSLNGTSGKPPKKSNNGTLPVRPLTYNFKGAEIVKKYPKLYAQNLAYIEAQHAHIAKVNKYKTTVNKVQSLGQGEQEVALNILKSKKLDLNDINSYEDKDFNTYINASSQLKTMEEKIPFKKKADAYNKMKNNPALNSGMKISAAISEKLSLLQSWWYNEDVTFDSENYKKNAATLNFYEQQYVNKVR